MPDFKIRQGLSTILFSEPGIINKRLIIEEGCWYLCTDTAELFLGVSNNGTLDLKKINENVVDAEIPTKLSELLNDCGFLTQIPDNYVVEEDIAGFALKTDLEGLATETYVNEKFSNIEIPEIPSKVSDLDNDLGYITVVPDSYATKEFVASEIAKAELEGQDIDLSYYYTKTETAEAITSAVETKADKSELFSKDYNELINKPNIPSIEGLATEAYVNKAITEINIPEIDTDGFVTDESLNDLLSTKADICPFADPESPYDPIIKTAVGSFSPEDSVETLSIAEILAKLLGLNKKSVDPDGPEIPDEPDIPDESKSVIETIVTENIPMYSISKDGSLDEIEYNYIGLSNNPDADNYVEKEPKVSGFYQVKDEASGSIIESGYQELQINNGDVYYIIALPKEIDYNTMVTIKAWSSLGEGSWVVADKFDMISDPVEVAELCSDAGIDISHIDTSIYTIWVSEDPPTGSKFRFVINE